MQKVSLCGVSLYVFECENYPSRQTNASSHKECDRRIERIKQICSPYKSSFSLFCPTVTKCGSLKLEFEKFVLMEQDGIKGDCAPNIVYIVENLLILS